MVQTLKTAGGNVTETSSTFFESPYHFQPTRKLSISSTAQNIETKYKYASDFRTSSCDAISDCYQTYANAVSQANATYQQQKQLCATQQCIFNNYQTYRSNLTLARRNYIDCRNNYMNPALAGSYAKCRLDAKAAAGTELKPVFQLMDQNEFTPIEISGWKNGKLTGASFNRFDYVTNPANIVYLNKMLAINLAQPSTTFSAAAVSSNTITKDSRYVDEVLLKFDNGNLVELTKKDGIVNTCIWGYNRLYTVAKVEGTSFASVNAILSQTIVQNPASDQALRDELHKIRQNFATALVTTYTYAKLIGPSSISEANNKSTYYEYDQLGRLKIIRDFNQNIQKTLDYKFQTIQ